MASSDDRIARMENGIARQDGQLYDISNDLDEIHERAKNIGKSTQDQARLLVPIGSNIDALQTTLTRQYKLLEYIDKFIDRIDSYKWWFIAALVFIDIVLIGTLILI